MSMLASAVAGVGGFLCGGPVGAAAAAGGVYYMTRGKSEEEEPAETVYYRARGTAGPPDQPHCEPTVFISKNGAKHVAWNCKIDAHDVEKHARKALERNPEAHVMFGTGVHGAPHHGFHKEDRHDKRYVEKEFYKEDAATAAKLREEFPKAKIDLYNLASPNSYDEFQQNSAPGRVKIHANCNGVHNSMTSPLRSSPSPSPLPSPSPYTDYGDNSPDDDDDDVGAPRFGSRMWSPSPSSPSQSSPGW